MKFDGVALAAEIEDKLKKRVVEMKKKPRLVIFVVKGNMGSDKYVAMKRMVAERVGIEVEVREMEDSLEKIKAEMKRVGEVDGVMIQMPIGSLKDRESEEILRLIPLEKDVDGLNPENIELIESGEQSFVPATVKAVEKILDYAYSQLEKDIDESMRVAVVGARGMVGRPLVMRLKRFGVEVGEFDLGDDLSGVGEYEVIISCTGKEGLIKKEMVKKGAICIDVGFPKADFESGLEGWVDFWTPVPGGVGPMTVVSLLGNVIIAALQAEGI